MAAPTGMLFDEPQAKPLSTVGVPMPGAYYLFFATGTVVPAAVYADGLLTTTLSQTPGQAQPSCTADANGRFNAIYLDPNVVYRVQLFNSSNVKLEDVDPYVVAASQNSLSQAATGLVTCTSGMTTNPSATAKFWRQGPMAMMEIPPILGTASAATNVAHFSIAYPTGFAPTIAKGGSMFFVNAGNVVPASFLMSSTEIQVSLTPIANFAAGSLGWNLSVVLNYPVD